MTITTAISTLDAIRNNRTDDPRELLATVNAIGFWAAKQKTSKRVVGLLSEAHSLAVRLEGRLA